ncbi:peptidoglycan D,D-transpeptidase FtsI family protein [Metabacillus sp. RGM 3146]|uniref:peptidoglycan D,D-transpeptidase FtsI family protein n=1 Tax=Metabacillus sp. RGM 3146 TaxID=3401092 RepID=UPI003B9A2A47
MKPFNRIKFSGVLIFFFLLLLLCRLAEIQLFNTESFSKHHINLIEESVKQRTQEVMINDGRGSFTDRNGLSLTSSNEPSVILFPFLKDYNWPESKLAEMLHLPPSIIDNKLASAIKPVIIGKKDGASLSKQELQEINKWKVPGLFGVLMEHRPEVTQVPHIVGFTAQLPQKLQSKYADKHLPSSVKLGAMGLEESFDEFLLPEAETKLLYHVDAIGDPLFGVNVKYIADQSPYYPVSITTTLDKKMQSMAEKILTSDGLQKGGLVLLDLANNSVLAMVSKPDLKLSDKNTQHNYMLEPLTPGSVFKTVLAAAAVEDGLDDPSKSYNCDLDLYGGHNPEHKEGPLSFSESFARSCNYTFSAIAAELIQKDPDSIERTADELGLLSTAGWTGSVYHYQNFQQFPHEKKGTVWSDKADKRVKKAIAQTAIGQKSVRVSPLAIANMMATIARGGQKKEVKIVEDIRYKNGTVMFHFPSQNLEGSSIDAYTAQKLQKLLRTVVTSENGTGRKFQSLPYAVSGKSGTAETGKADANGQSLINKWFAGYFPSDNPRYALVVTELEVTGNKTSANQVFYDMVKEIFNSDQGHSG